MADILEFTGATKCDLPPDKLLSAAPGKMERVVIIGIDKDGNEYLSSSVADCAITAVQAMANRLSHGRWLYLQSGVVDRTVSQAAVDAKLAVDANLATAFGSHYVDTYAYMRANGTGSTVGSGGAEVWPLDSCTSASDGHPSAAQGQPLLAAIITAELASRGW